MSIISKMMDMLKLLQTQDTTIPTTENQKKQKALKGNDLLESIYILRVLLEYHVCLSLGIDRRDAIAQELRTHNDWKQLSEIQAKQCKSK